MELETIKSAWENFRETVLAKHDLNEETMYLMEMIFFSGAKALFTLMLIHADSDNDDGIDKLAEELEQFRNGMKEKVETELAKMMQGLSPNA